MSDLGLSLFDLVLVLMAISVGLVCVGISLYSASKKERETQFHELWFMTDRSKNTKSDLASNRVEFEA
jgi:hypothetical protein